MSKHGKGQRCAYCRRTLEAKGSRGWLAATRDHTTPSRNGGEHTVWCCRFCNMQKGGVQLHIWLHFIATTPDYWRKHNAHLCDDFRRKYHRYEVLNAENQSQESCFP